MPLPSCTAVTPAEVAAMSNSRATEIVAGFLAAARPWLAVESKGTDLHDVTDFHAWATAINDRVRRTVLPVECRLDSRELAVRADRALGMVVRNCQDAGLLRRYGASSQPGVPTFEELGMRRDSFRELIYPVTDGVDDEEFEQALAHARRGTTIGRRDIANRLRERHGTAQQRHRRRIEELVAQGLSVAEIAAEVGSTRGSVRDSIARYGGIVLAPDSRTPTARITNRGRFIKRDAMRAMNEQLYALALVVDGAEGLDPQIDSTEAARWREDLSRGRKNLTTLLNLLKERTDA